LNQVRFGKWQDVLAHPMPAQRDGLEEGIWRYAQARALHALKRNAEATEHINVLRQLAALPTSATTKLFDEEPVQGVVQILMDVLEGERALAAGQIAAGVASFARAAQAEDALKIQDPPMLGVHVRPLFGKRLLQGGQFAQAEALAREDLMLHPGSGWSLAVLADALKGQSKFKEMNEVLSRIGASKKNFDS
jgi:tetratricopeptide (TPR) repeat protein